MTTTLKKALLPALFCVLCLPVAARAAATGTAPQRVNLEHGISLELPAGWQVTKPNQANPAGGITLAVCQEPKARYFASVAVMPVEAEETELLGLSEADYKKKEPEVRKQAGMAYKELSRHMSRKGQPLTVAMHAVKRRLSPQPATLGYRCVMKQHLGDIVMTEDRYYMQGYKVVLSRSWMAGKEAEEIMRIPLETLKITQSNPPLNK